jgi:hypothetical protein
MGEPRGIAQLGVDAAEVRLISASVIGAAVSCVARICVRGWKCVRRLHKLQPPVA